VDQVHLYMVQQENKTASLVDEVFKMEEEMTGQKKTINAVKEGMAKNKEDIKKLSWDMTQQKNQTASLVGELSELVQNMTEQLNTTVVKQEVHTERMIQEQDEISTKQQGLVAEHIAKLEKVLAEQQKVIEEQGDAISELSHSLVDVMSYLKLGTLGSDERDPIDTYCPPLCTRLDTGCYLFNDTAMTQSEARMFCENVDSHLAEVNSEEEHVALAAEINRQKKKGVFFWLGITDRNLEGSWVLESNGESVPFTDWKTGEPNDAGSEGEDCAHWDSDMKWNDRHCDDDQIVWNSDSSFIWTALCEI